MINVLQEKKGKAQVYQAPHYRIKLNNGDSITIPVEVYQYFQQNKQLSEDVYGKVGTGALGGRDDDLRDYFANPKIALESILPATEVMVNLTDDEQEAIYRIEGYQKVWWRSMVARSSS